MEKICPKCLSIHNKPGIFCSRSCANSRNWTEEQNEKRKDSIVKTLSLKTPEELKRDTEKATLASSEKRRKNLLESPTTALSHNRIRKKIYSEQNGKCDCCGISEWQEKPIVLELDHIDGDNKNNKRENLRMLCPNCHSQTPTWKVGNKPHWRKN
jgi:hypothetical protein